MFEAPSPSESKGGKKGGGVVVERVLQKDISVSKDNTTTLDGVE